MLQACGLGSSQVMSHVRELEEVGRLEARLGVMEKAVAERNRRVTPDLES